jgi:NADH:ubiquinone oxidoreductase subunit D
MWQPCWLETDRFGAHIRGMTEFVEWLTGTHTCDCGAKYKVTVTEVPTDNVICEQCGTLMDSRPNESFLTYERMPGEE